ncbi:MAG: hypothetical protein C0599_11675 [Salinivirgaceae bacterium]|nr:MAG: hypothetical protein C0599_11675 [Salinivirgaceae bacterium]
MDKKLEEIIYKSAELFKQYGVRSVSMDDISREMGISKKTLYKHVKNKNELVEKILEFTFEREQQFFCDKAKPEVNAIDALLEVSIFISEQIKLFTPSVSFDLKKYYPEVFKAHMEKSQKYAYEAVYTNLVNGINQGLYRKEINPEVVATLYVNKIEDVHDQEFYTEKDFSFELIFETMFENHIRGIANEKGIAYFEKRRKDYKL